MPTESIRVSATLEANDYQHGTRREDFGDVRFKTAESFEATEDALIDDIRAALKQLKADAKASQPNKVAVSNSGQTVTLNIDSAGSDTFRDKTVKFWVFTFDAFSVLKARLKPLFEKRGFSG